MSGRRIRAKGEWYWLPEVQQLNAVIHGAHQSGWYVRLVGRSADRFDLLLAPLSKPRT